LKDRFPLTREMSSENGGASKNNCRVEASMKGWKKGMVPAGPKVIISEEVRAESEKSNIW